MNGQTRSESGLTPRQLAQLQARLEAEREALTGRLKARRHRLTELARRQPDDADWAADSSDQSLLARLVDRDAKLLAEVAWALGKFARGDYGICETTGEPIGFERLQARPWSRHSLVAKERREREEIEEGPEVLERSPRAV